MKKLLLAAGTIAVVAVLMVFLWRAGEQRSGRESFPPPELASGVDRGPESLPSPDYDGHDDGHDGGVGDRSPDGSKLAAAAAHEHAPSADDPVARLRERLFAASERFVIERTLWELAAIGTPEAIGVVLECMTGGPDFEDEARVFAEVLSGVEDERIAPTARIVLNDDLASGESSWRQNGYCELLARHGGPAEQAFLLELVAQEDLEQVREGALWALFAHGPQGIENDLLGLLPDLYRRGSDVPLGAMLLRGVLDQSDAGLRDAVWHLAEDPTLEQWGRESILDALAGSVRSAEDIRDFVERHQVVVSGPEASRSLLPSLGRALSGVPAEERVRARAWILPALREALASGERGRVASAIAFVKQDPGTFVGPLRRELTGLRGDELSETARTALRELGF